MNIEKIIAIVNALDRLNNFRNLVAKASQEFEAVANGCDHAYPNGSSAFLIVTNPDKTRTCQICRQDIKVEQVAASLPSDMKHPRIAVDRATKQIAIFDEFETVSEYEPYEDEAAAVAKAKARIAVVTALEPTLIYPRIDKAVFTSAPVPRRRRGAED